MRRLLSPLLCAGVLAGCGTTAHAPRVAAPTPPGFVVRTVAQPRLSIALPRRWRALDRRTALTPQRIKTFARGNQGLRAELEALSKPHSPIKLMAIDPGERRAFAASMNVLQTQVPSQLSFDDLARNEARQIKLVAAVKNMRQQETKLPAGQALRLSYDVRSNAVVQQYFVKSGRYLYVLTYTAPRAASRRYSRIFDLSAHTFRVG